MCGIVAVVGNLFEADKRVFDIMLKLDTVRGHHSTGVMYVEDNKRKHPKIVKELGTPWDLINKNYDGYYNLGPKEMGNGTIKGNMLCMIGHNRWATVGDITPKNAHPFEAGDIIGVQNGTLQDYQRRKLPDWEKYGTDTEALLNAIDKEGLDIFKKVDGAWALAWWDKEEGSFNMMHNKERPLYYAWKKGGHVMYVASVPDFIYYAVEREKIELENGLVYSVNEDVLYTYKVGKQHDFSEKVETAFDVPKYVQPIYTGTNQFKGTVISPPTGGTTTDTKHGGQGSQSNVVPFTRENASGVNQANAAKSTSFFEGSLQAGVNHWQKAVGSFKEFSIASGKFKDEQGKLFTLGYTIDENVAIRIYPSATVDLNKLLDDPTVATFSAKIKRVKTNGKRFYLLVDPDHFYVCTRRKGYWESQTKLIQEAQAARQDTTQTAFDKMFDGSPSVIVAYNGEQIDANEFKRRAKIGCVWCSQVPDVRECTEIKWLSKTDFLCTDCASDEDVMQYVRDMAVGQ